MGKARRTQSARRATSRLPDSSGTRAAASHRRRRCTRTRAGTVAAGLAVDHRDVGRLRRRADAHQGCEAPEDLRQPRLQLGLLRHHCQPFEAVLHGYAMWVVDQSEAVPPTRMTSPSRVPVRHSDRTWSAQGPGCRDDRQGRARRGQGSGARGPGQDRQLPRVLQRPRRLRLERRDGAVGTLRGRGVQCRDSR
jgi:hypothetical protein